MQCNVMWCGVVWCVQHSSCRMRYPQLLEGVNHVMGFLYSEVFLANDEVMFDSYS
jgi:hypothetical protein